MRLAFLSAQLGKERERRLIALARQAADSGNFTRAISFLDRAAQGQKNISPLLAQARREIEQRRVGTSAENLLKKANERLQEDKLIAPEGDSAETYILAALAADPANVTAQQARRALGDQAADEGQPGDRCPGLRCGRAMADATPTRWAPTFAPHSALSTRRASRMRVLNSRLSSPPASMSASRRVACSPRNATAQAITGANFEPQIHRTRACSRHCKASVQDCCSNRRPAWRRATSGQRRPRSMQRRHSDSHPRRLTAAEQQTAAARERSVFMSNVIDGATLARDKYVAPRYPAEAQRKGIDGWVELEFTVAAGWHGEGSCRLPG